jgi:hypothetical protein
MFFIACIINYAARVGRHISALSERQSIRDLRGNQPQAMVPLTLEMGKKARSLSLYTLGLIFITDL